MSERRRWLSFLATTLLACGCGILLGMFMLSIFTGQEVNEIQSGLNSQDVSDAPKAVKASSIATVAGQPMKTNEKQQNGKDLVGNNVGVLIEKQIFFPITEWSFIQAGVFNNPSYAAPIIKQWNVHAINPQMMDDQPTRVMLAGFLEDSKADAVSKQLRITGIELYTRKLHTMYNSITLELPETEASFYDQQLNQELTAYFEQLQRTSYDSITGVGSYTNKQLVLEKGKELQSVVTQLRSYGANNENMMLLFLTAELMEIEQILKDTSIDNQQVGWLIQEHLLKLLSKCKIMAT